MAEINLSCDVMQGFNFQKDAQCLIGHLSQLEISSDDKGKFEIDMGVSNPTKIGGDEETKDKVVAVISNIYWAGGLADPIYIGCRISTENKTKAATLQYTTLSDTKVKFKFIIYDYDPANKIFYPCFHCDDVLEGLVAKDPTADDLEFGVDMNASDDINSPKNYNFYVAIMPNEVEKKVNLAFDKDAKITKKWGVKVGAK